MSVNIVNKTTGELIKVAGNVAPPTDSVTNGDMRPVTSNSVYDAIHDAYTVNGQSGETYGDLILRLNALIPDSKKSGYARLRVSAMTLIPSNYITKEFVACVPVVGTGIANTSISFYKVFMNTGKYYQIKQTFNSSGVSTTTLTDLSNTNAADYSISFIVR